VPSPSSAWRETYTDSRVPRPRVRSCESAGTLSVTADPVGRGYAGQRASAAIEQGSVEKASTSGATLCAAPGLPVNSRR
jgi:hypothetical protein